ncbi:aldose epimerase family protein [Weissella viridescens]|uniref:aldose epimerase family protein n=1 Tax=Weissella viridescens TaxID=1629 RepID=UPI0022E2D62C|nr:aldose epimerase family protein [Weissella viridescens]
MITKTHFGEVSGKPVEKYTIENQNQTRLSVLTYAGIVQEFSVIDNNERVNLVLSSDRIEGFSENTYNINRVIGRTAGRITKGTWTQDGVTHHVPTNDGENTLHSGPEGVGTQFFDVKSVDEDKNQLQLTYTALESVDGFPGDLDITVTYTLTENDTVDVTFTGHQTKQAGVFNPTVHMYFNLANPGITDLTDHDLFINSDQHLAVNAEKCPTGELIDNAGTSFDLKHHHDLGEILPELKKTTVEQGFDDVFKVPANQDTVAAKVTDRVSGRHVAIHSDRNGIVAFTESQIGNDVKYLNLGESKPWMAVALEAQTLPDSENHPELGDVSIAADETQEYHIQYVYGK